MTQILFTEQGRPSCWRLPFSSRQIRTILEKMLQQTGKKDILLEVLLADDKHMAILNFESMKCHGPTNVLSFPAEQERYSAFAGKKLWGCLVLAPETITRECLLYGQPPEHHTIHLLAHGIAHLLGYDHSPAMDSITVSLEAAGHFAIQ